MGKTTGAHRLRTVHYIRGDIGRLIGNDVKLFFVQQTVTTVSHSHTLYICYNYHNYVFNNSVYKVLP